MILELSFKNYYYQQSNLREENIEEELYELYCNINSLIKERLSKSQNKSFNDEDLIKYLFAEISYYQEEFSSLKIKDLLKENTIKNQISAIVFDKFFFNELNPYHSLSLLKKEDAVISTIDLNINFVLNRLDVIKKVNSQNNILIDMMNKAFLMFKTINYLLISGAETEAFSTWRTIHELECIIKVIFDHPDIVPTYLQHIVYNNAFRDEFEDKEAQQAVIDDLKARMRSHDLKSKDMKKFIEYGWLYSIEGLEQREGFKLNFRNGLELAANLSSYSQDYEMSSEVAHSSPLLIYSNKGFFKSVTVVRTYESFLRLEEILYKTLKSYQNIDSSSYEKMRNLYLRYLKDILNREISLLRKLVQKNK